MDTGLTPIKSKRLILIVYFAEAREYLTAGRRLGYGFDLGKETKEKLKEA
jgi:hypothetical protein